MLCPKGFKTMEDLFKSNYRKQGKQDYKQLLQTLKFTGAKKYRLNKVLKKIHEKYEPWFHKVRLIRGVKQKL